MPQSYQEHNGDNSTHTYTIAFGSGTTKYLKREHIKLYYGRDRVAGTQTNTLTLDTDYVYVSEFVIKLIGSTLNTGVTVGDPYPLASGRKLTIERDTPQDSLLVPWADGSQLTKEALETSNLQVLFGQQEEADSGLLNSTEARAATTASNTATSNVATLTANPIFSGNFGSTAISVNDSTNINLGSSGSSDSSISYNGAGSGALDIDTAGQFSVTSTGNQNFKIGSTLRLALIDSSVDSADGIYCNWPVVPGLNDTYDLGTDDFEWRDIYIDGTAYLDTADIGSITGDAIVTSGVSTSDTKVYSAKRTEDLFLRQDNTETLASGVEWAANDTTVATTGAIDARVRGLITDVGGFRPIANEASFPTTNPDPDDNAGTIVSITALSATRTASGTNLTAGCQTTTGTQVTITGCPSGQVFQAGYGLLVETTSTLNTYTFVRYLADTSSVATISTKASEIGLLGTAAAIEDLGILGTADVVADMAILGTTDVVADMNTLAVTSVVNNIASVANVSGSVDAIGSDLANNYANITDYGAITGAVSATSGTSDITTVADSIANVNAVGPIAANVTTVAGISSNVTSVANNATNINTCATNISSITGAATQATNAAASATAAETAKTAAETAQTAAAASATSAASSASTSTAQAAIATTQATNAAASASTANTHQLTAKQWRDDASGIKTQAESNVYNLSGSVSSHTAWGNITDIGTTHFSSESGNILLTMTKGSAVYDYGAVA